MQPSSSPGAGAGIGRSAVEAFAREGALIYAIDRNDESLADLRSAAGNVTPIHVDITDVQALAGALEPIDTIDVLFNCAGVVANGTVLETSDADWEQSWKVNVTGTFRTTQTVLPKMLARGRGTIINMSSVVSSVKGLPNRFAYGTSKAAVIGMTKSIAADFVGQGIRCVAICPGTVDTPSLHQRLKDTGDYDAAMSEFIARQPMGRIASAQEITELVLYAASDAAAYMTGQALVIDGGITI